MAGGVKAHTQRSISPQKEPHSRPNLGGREGWTTKEQGTQHQGSRDRGKTDTRSSSDDDGGASSSQESVTNDPNAKDHAVETMEKPTEGHNLFHEPLFSAVTLRWKKTAHRVTQTKITHTKVWETTAQLNKTPMVENIRELTLLDARASQPLGEVALQGRLDDRPLTKEDGKGPPNKDWPKTPTSGNWNRSSRRSRLFYDDQTMQPGCYDPVAPLTWNLWRTREKYDPYSRRMDPNEHHTRRHKYDTGLPPPNRKMELAPYGKRDEDNKDNRMLRRLTAAQQVRSADDQGKIVQNPTSQNFYICDIRQPRLKQPLVPLNDSGHNFSMMAAFLFWMPSLMFFPLCCSIHLS
jgi:hypothetical protein